MAAKRRTTTIVFAAGALLAGLAAASTGCGATEPLRPNLVLITADAVRPDWLVCYGAESQLGAEACALGDPGALYEWAFSTAPSGAPSAASMLTSTYPTQHGVSDDPSTFLPTLGPPTLADTLRAGGYATAAFVSSPELNRSRHIDRGFDHFDDHAATDERSPAPSVGLRARAWAASARAPWFVWVHFTDPHGPFAAGSRRQYRAEYAEALRRLDRQLSQLIAVLDSDRSPPAILLTALHGQEVDGGATSRGHGTSLLPAQIRVPLLWRSPRSGGGTGVGRRIEAPVSLIDVGPTLVEAAGLRVPESFEGHALPHSDPGPGAAPSRTLYAVAPHAVAVIRSGELAIFPRTIVPGPGDPSPAPIDERIIRLDLDDAADGEEPGAGLGDPRHELARLPTRWRSTAANSGPATTR